MAHAQVKCLYIGRSSAVHSDSWIKRYRLSRVLLLRQQ